MAKAKTALNLLLWVCEMDAYCLQGHRSALKFTKNHIRDQNFFWFRPQKAETMPFYYSKPTKPKKPRRNQ